jgi:hypothetical protein
MKNVLIAAVVSVILSGQAFATDTPPVEPSPPVTKVNNANANKNLNNNVNSNRTVNNNDSSAKAVSDSRSNAESDATVISDVNVGGDNHYQVRQAPSVAQGSFAIQGCGAAGNAGGSNTHGSAFMGFGFTPAECYAFLLAQSYQAVGERKAACEILNSTKTAQRAAKRGVKLPDCNAIREVIVVEFQKVDPPKDVMPPAYTYSREEIDAKINRAFKKGVSK